MTTKTQHTALPWVNEYPWINPHHEVPEGTICIMQNSHLDRSKNNAAFICLAVNNHERLVKALKDIMTECAFHEEGDAGWDCVRNNARTVLAQLGE